MLLASIPSKMQEKNIWKFGPKLDGVDRTDLEKFAKYMPPESREFISFKFKILKSYSLAWWFGVPFLIFLTNLHLFLGNLLWIRSLAFHGKLSQGSWRVISSKSGEISGPRFCKSTCSNNIVATVDGSEIRRLPVHQLVVYSLSHYFFKTLGYLQTVVVWDFWSINSIALSI